MREESRVGSVQVFSRTQISVTKSRTFTCCCTVWPVPFAFFAFSGQLNQSEAKQAETGYDGSLQLTLAAFAVGGSDDIGGQWTLLGHTKSNPLFASFAVLSKGAWCGLAFSEIWISNRRNTLHNRDHRSIRLVLIRYHHRHYGSHEASQPARAGVANKQNSISTQRESLTDK